MGTSSSKNNKPKPLTENQYKKIFQQQIKSLCQIITKEGKSTGFLCNIPNPVLITSSHAISEDHLKPGETIKICFKDMNNDKNYKTIIIDEDRIICMIEKINDEEINTTIIELNPDNDDLNDQEFIEIDDDLMNDEIKKEYYLKDFYVLKYKGEEAKTENGIINEIIKGKNSYDLSYIIDFDNGDSGNPIILYNHKVIGIHRCSDNKLKKGTLLQYPIKEYRKKLEQKKLTKKNEKKILFHDNINQNNITGNQNMMNNNNIMFNNNFNPMMNYNYMMMNMMMFNTISNINLFFLKSNDQNSFPIRILCNTNEKIFNIIMKYREISGDFGQNKFIYNGKELDLNLSVRESGIFNNANIFVVSIKNENIGNFINLIFRIEGLEPVPIICNPDDNFSVAIQKYRERSGNNDYSFTFMHNAKKLSPNLKIREISGSININIYVIPPGIKGGKTINC